MNLKSIPPLPNSSIAGKCPWCKARIAPATAEDHEPSEWGDLFETMECPECNKPLDLHVKEFVSYELTIRARRTPIDVRYMAEMGVTEKDVQEAHKT